MGRLSYVNGQYVPHALASVHIEDRGFQFSDGVYEVIAVQNGHLIDFNDHLDRLDRSLAGLDMAPPMARAALKLVIRTLLNKNHITFGALYLQITRGQAARDFPFPTGIKPTLVLSVKRLKPFDFNLLSQGVDVITIPDLRWKRCDLKTVSLLAGAMGKTQAKAQGAFEAWQVDEAGNVTEGTSSNAWIITNDGVLITRPTDHAMLAGVTRQTIMKLAQQENFKFIERPFSVDEAKAACEAFTSSTTAFIRPVVRLDGRKIGTGKPGAFCLNVLKLYGQYMKSYQDPTQEPAA